MKVIGMVREIYKDDSLPTIKEAYKELEPEKKLAVLAYLKSGKVTAAAPAISRDVLTGEKIGGSLVMQTDGEYAWRSDVAYYFEKYNIDLGYDFIAHVLVKGMNEKICDDSLDFEELRNKICAMSDEEFAEYIETHQGEYDPPYNFNTAPTKEQIEAAKKLEEEYLNRIPEHSKIDDYGPLTEHMPDDATRYDFGKIKKYCDEHSKTLADLTEEEIKRFKVN